MLPPLIFAALALSATGYVAPPTLFTARRPARVVALSAAGPEVVRDGAGPSSASLADAAVKNTPTAGAADSEAVTAAVAMAIEEERVVEIAEAEVLVSSQA